jgi:hypothetical protein
MDTPTAQGGNLVSVSAPILYRSRLSLAEIADGMTSIPSANNWRRFDLEGQSAT